MFTTAAFDNFDHDEAVLSGVGGSHDTVMVLFQEKPPVPLKKPNIHETAVRHGEKFPQELECQKLRSFSKPSKKPALPSDYTVVEKSLAMDEAEYKRIQIKNLAWNLCRMDLTKIPEVPLTESQGIPVWSAFNATISDTLQPSVHNVGFLPMIPHPITQYETVYTALKNLQDILKQLKQQKLPVTCDEGVYRIAREIMLLRPAEFKNIILMLGSFHMTKIFLGCIGKYLRDSGAESIFIESHVFGPHIVYSVLQGSNYVRSLKGVQFLGEAMKRLQIMEFFKSVRPEKYQSEIMILEKLQTSVKAKDIEKSKIFIKEFLEKGEKLLTDLQMFVCTQREKSETFKYWDNFLIMVSLLNDYLRADRERNWRLSVQTVELFMGIFCAFDRTNYIRWGSFFVEDMKSLAETAPKVFDQFMNRGNFVIQRSKAPFTAVGGDLCLEQTINRSQKSTSGVIGVTRRKTYVAEWEIIYHEILSVYNLYRNITLVSSTDNYELRMIHHDFTQPVSEKSEELVSSMIKFILMNENPFEPSITPLHNIITKEVVPEESRAKILNIISIGNEAYVKLRDERFVAKTALPSDVIHRLKIPSFKPQNTVNSNQKSALRKKEQAAVQHVITLAQERGLSTQELLTYDIVKPKMLFDEEGFMTKSPKSTLCDGLEKVLQTNDLKSVTKSYSVPCSYVVDVLGCARKLLTKKMINFGDFANAFLQFIHRLTGNDLLQIDFIFDSYINISPKSYERSRRASAGSVEIQAIHVNTPLPVKMETFWSSSENKTKLQEFLGGFILENGVKNWPGAKIFCSATMGNKNVMCTSRQSNGEIQEHKELSFPNLEEADVRIMPHILHAIKEGIKQLVILSSDTDVLVLALHFMNRFCSDGLEELWMRLGIGVTSRYVPIHIMAQRHGNDLCLVLPALHLLTGSDYTSKFGTKNAALKGHPSTFLMNFGRTEGRDLEDSLAKAEKYLVNIVKKGSTCESMDELRYWMYYHTKNKSLEDLPPTSRITRQHILRAFFCTYI